MKRKDNIVLLCNDLLIVLKKYTDTLDAYFRCESMKDNHNFLYKEYLFLMEDINKISRKYVK